MNEDELNQLLNDVIHRYESIHRLQHLTKDELNYLLEGLIRQVQQQKPPARQRLLTRLIQVLARSSWFKRQRPEAQKYHDRYEQILEEGLSLFWARFCKEIDRFRAERSPAVGWIAFLLDKCVKEAVPLVWGNPKFQVRSLDDFESYPQEQPAEEPNASVLELVDACIQEDAEGTFQKHVENFPPATFQAIHQCKREGETLQQIADRFGIPSLQTVRAFYTRNLARFNPQIVAYVREYGQFSQQELERWRELGL